MLENGTAYFWRFTPVKVVSHSAASPIVKFMSLRWIAVIRTRSVFCWRIMPCPTLPCKPEQSISFSKKLLSFLSIPQQPFGLNGIVGRGATSNTCKPRYCVCVLTRIHESRNMFRGSCAFKFSRESTRAQPPSSQKSAAWFLSTSPSIVLARIHPQNQRKAAARSFLRISWPSRYAPLGSGTIPWISTTIDSKET
jgi:hypothetical protein